MEQLSDWLKRIREVEYVGGGTERLSIRYDDGGEEVLEIRGENKGRYVEVKKEGGITNFNGKYRLIEEQPELGKGGDFRHCIFLVGIEFKEKEIEEEVNFSWSIFTQETNLYKNIFRKRAGFLETTFQRRADFSSATFQGEANFGSATFKKKTNFRFATFQKGTLFELANFQERVNFLETIFENEAYFTEVAFQEEVDFTLAAFQGETDFGSTTFENEVYFTKATFQGRTIFESTIFRGEAGFGSTTFENEVYFTKATFQTNANFLKTTFQGMTNFSFSKIDFLNFSAVKEESHYTINLKFAQIEAIDYTDTEFSKAANRETYLILKNLALKQNDQIRALDFYKEEMEQHREELKARKKSIDRIILGIESCVSEYGTNPIKPMLFLFFFNVILLILTKVCLGDDVSVGLILSFFTFRYSNNSLTWVHLLALILNPFLIYEIVKSLRKFSRKL